MLFPSSKAAKQFSWLLKRNLLAQLLTLVAWQAVGDVNVSKKADKH